MIKSNQKWAYKSAKVQCKSHVKLKLTGKWKMTLLTVTYSANMDCLGRV